MKYTYRMSFDIEIEADSKEEVEAKGRAVRARLVMHMLNNGAELEARP